MERPAADGYLKDGGALSQRRHSCFVADGALLERTPHRAHWQPVEYNALHGGMQRWFEPIADDVVASAAWTGLLRGLAATCSQVRPVARWSIEAHQFRIDTADGIGGRRPKGRIATASTSSRCSWSRDVA